jgi:hypothetical protein
LLPVTGGHPRQSRPQNTEIFLYGRRDIMETWYEEVLFSR